MNWKDFVPLVDVFSGIQFDSITAQGCANVSLSNMIDDFSLLMYTYRCDHELTQGELAKQLGVTQAMVSSYEAGNRNPSLKTVAETAASMGYMVSLSYMPIKSQMTSMVTQTDIDSHIDDIAFAA